MEDLIIGLQIKPTITLTNKHNGLKKIFLIENIEDVFEEDGVTIVKYYTSEFYSLLAFHAKESAKTIIKHIDLASKLKEKCLKMLNELKPVE